MLITIIDQYPIPRLGIKKICLDNFKTLISQEFESVIQYSNSHSDVAPDLIILGCCYESGGNNIENVKLLKKRYPKTGIVLYEDDLSLPLISEYLRLGVNGYLSLDANLQEVVVCVEQALKSEIYFNCNRLLYLLRTYKFGTEQKNINTSEVKLSSRELEIAEYLADGQTNSWISQKIDTTPSTISTIKRNIYKKLMVENIIQLREQMQLIRLK